MSMPCIQPNLAQIALSYGLSTDITLNVGYTPVVRGANGEFRMIPIASTMEDPELKSKIYAHARKDPAANVELSRREITNYFRDNQHEVTNVCTQWGVIAANELDETNPGASLANDNRSQQLSNQQKSSSPANVLIAPGNLDISGFRKKNQANPPAPSEALLNDRKGPTL